MGGWKEFTGRRVDPCPLKREAAFLALVARPAMATGRNRVETRDRPSERQSRPRRTTSSFDSIEYGRTIRNCPVRRGSSTDSRSRKNSGVLSGKGFAARVPKARVRIPRKWHQTAALVASKTLRPADTRPRPAFRLPERQGGPRWTNARHKPARSVRREPSTARSPVVLRRLPAGKRANRPARTPPSATRTGRKSGERRRFVKRINDQHGAVDAAADKDRDITR